MSQLTESGVVRVLAERDGKHWVDQHRVGIPDYLHSTDSLRPVLAKLNHWEKRLVVERIALMYEASGEHGLMWYGLTLPPDQLARCVAEAILACRKEKV